MPRAIRAHFQVYTRDSDARASIAETGRENGFVQSEVVNPYRRAVVVDHEPSNEDIMMSFHSTGRGDIRELRIEDLSVRRITETDCATRGQQRLDETFVRTGRTSQALTGKAGLHSLRSPPIYSPFGARSGRE